MSRSWRPPVAWGLLLPGLGVLLFAYAMPMLWVLRMAFNRFTGGGGIEITLTLDSFADVFTDPYYLRVALTTVKLGLLVAAITVLVAYPLALFLVRTTSKWRGLLTILAIAPMLVSSVARTYGWMVVLGNQGLLSAVLTGLGLTDTPPQLANQFAGVVIALVQIFLPYAVLAMTSGFGRLDATLEQAAASLGAGRITRFLRVTLPLTLPGVLTGLLLVFVLTISAYVTPRLIGGGRVFVLASEIYDQATNQLNWPLAAALSLVLVIVFGIAVTVFGLLQRRVERWVSGR
ncbi:ABC transporter permease [Actinoplanes rectilineatus]|uniref:ABC transporter permease n=1 Tax=Actinoplanes rectilineatus TaxID=113571 RepID=UPI0005F2BC60|nr:ABC transporter permease [Actinoplanes rectilineatus]